MKILVTGAEGFIGRNLISHLKHTTDHQISEIGRKSSPSDLQQALMETDFVFHLAGVNRPKLEEEFYIGNVELTAQICDYLAQIDREVPLVFSSSTQAILDNPYGRSKRQAEHKLTNYAETSGHPVVIYRLTNVFGKWCRPNYNSVVATFCHNIARDLPITISNRDIVVELVHVDDVVSAFVSELGGQHESGVHYHEAAPHYKVTLGELVDLLTAFKEMRQSLIVPPLDNPFTHRLYSTYLSYLEADNFAYSLQKRSDPRGCLAEFVKSESFGQIFVSRTEPGITRGNHYHHLKTEKFLVLEGEAIVRFRHIEDASDIIEYPVHGEEFKVVDIPPGYTHSIENIGTNVLITLFWASEIFDPTRPDTAYLDVLSQ